ncbi:hypothetical protein TNCV_1153611 [Trichonephila clavipes]|nr:hypothetical protein TNCV_1153611 [Trichonephila clavipes]
MYRYRCPCSFETISQLINRSDCRKVTNQSLGNHGTDVFYWFVVDHIIEDAFAGDAASRVAAAMVSELRVHAAANVVELFVLTLSLANDPDSRFRARDGAARSLKAMRVTCLFSRLLVIEGR